MNKQLLLTFAIVLVVALSAGTIYASEVNVTGSDTVNMAENSLIAASDESSELSVSDSVVDNDSSDDVLKSKDSSTLSTNTENGGNVLSSDSNDTANTTIDLSKTVTAKDVTKYYKGSAKYTATFLDINGMPIKNTNVKILVNGKTYTKKTDSNGVASLSINLKPGTYKVTSTNPVTGFKLTTTFMVLSTISAKDVKKVYADGKKFSATFYKSNGKVLANKKVKFKIGKKTYTKKTNKKGVASISLTSLKKGTHKIISYNVDGLKKTNKVKVYISVTTSLTTSSYTFLKSETKKIRVKLLNKFGYAPQKGKIIKFKVNGKTYKAKTNSKGYATVKLPSLKIGTYTVKYTFSKSGYYKGSSAKNKLTIIPTKNPTYTVKSTTTFGKGAGTQFKVALSSGSIPLVNKKVTLSVDGSSYTKTTDSKGIVSLPINLDVGNYTISYSNKADSKTNAKTASTPIMVVERGDTNISWTSSTSFTEGTRACTLFVVDSNNNAVTSGTVVLNVNGKTYSGSLASNGYVTISAGLTSGVYNVSYTFNGNNLNAPSSGSTLLNVSRIDKISINNIINGAKNLKSYYETNKNFPSTVSAGGYQFTVPEFLYLMSEAIVNLGNSKTGDVAIIYGVSNPSSPSGDDIDSKDLTKANFLKVAANIANYIKSNKKAPNYASSAIGKIIYSELVDASSRILAFYGTNKRLPNYVIIGYTSGSSSSQAGTGLNEKNTVKDLTQYLKSTKNCQVDNADIKKVVTSLTKGLTSASAKAKAIFEYVKDTLSYSFYYNTKYGAVGTLKSKQGNCVDHTHLLVAMFRTADLPARYVHGTCKFTSGSTYGHVWAQVLIDGKWTIADATSSRNYLGSVANWNTKSFSLNGIYSSLSF